MHTIESTTTLGDYTAAIEAAGRDELSKSGICPDLANHVNWADYALRIALDNGYLTNVDPVTRTVWLYN